MKYLVNITFDHSRVKTTYNQGTFQNFDELKKSEIDYLLLNGYISSKKLKGKEAVEDGKNNS